MGQGMQEAHTLTGHKNEQGKISSGSLDLSPKYLVVDIGGTKIQAGVAEKTATGFEISKRERIPTLAQAGGKQVAERLAQLLKKMSAEANCQAIGVASAGVVDSERGRIRSATDIMPGWAGTELGKILYEATGLNTYMLGDVHGHCLGEARQGAGRKYRQVLSCGVGTGIGGAFSSEGKIQVGSQGIAGHIGHVYHPLALGITCSCGREGHIEAIASGTGIGKYFARTYGKTGLDGKAVSDLAQKGDPEAVKAIAELGFALGQCLGSIANVLDPEIVIISGSVAESGENWWKSLRKGYRDQALNDLQQIEMVKAQTGDLAPLLGAAYWAHEHNLA